MKLPEEDRCKLRSNGRDKERFHSMYDEMIRARLKELDPEYMDDIEGLMEKQIDAEVEGGVSLVRIVKGRGNNVWIR